jgi:hypothetical protein
VHLRYTRHGQDQAELVQAMLDPSSMLMLAKTAVVCTCVYGCVIVLSGHKLEKSWMVSAFHCYHLL